MLISPSIIEHIKNVRDTPLQYSLIEESSSGLRIINTHPNKHRSKGNIDIIFIIY